CGYIRHLHSFPTRRSSDLFCLQPDFVAGVRLLAEYHLSFDLCIKHWQLPGAIELVRRCPDTAFILDHLGKPDIKEQQLDPWQARSEEHTSELQSRFDLVCR